MSGPVASNLVLLRELEGCAPGTKVRFLGCVDEYVVKTATLRLRHDSPHSESAKIANVNIDHVLEVVQHAAVDVGSWINVMGSWINVMGYVERRKEKGIFVQAVALWDAGNVDLATYEEAVEKRTKLG